MSAKDDERAVGRGETITDILAHDDGKFWFQKPHLLRLNLLLCVPLLSSAISGYDVRLICTKSYRFLFQPWGIEEHRLMTGMSLSPLGIADERAPIPGTLDSRL